MLRRNLRVFIVLLFLVPVALGVWFLMPSDKDVEQYHALVNKSQSAKETKKDPYVATQFREGVIKDIYTSNGHGHLMARVASDRSRLVFDQQPEGMNILEHLEQLTCTMQKELFFMTKSGDELVADGKGGFKDRKGKPVNVDIVSLKPMQVARLVIADKAVYDYNNEKLVADHPTVFEYKLEGHQFPESFSSATQMIRGVAENAELSFDNGEMVFHAKRLKARYFPNGGGP